MRDLDFVVEVADIADDRLVLHPAHLVGGDDVLVAGGGDENIRLGQSILNGGDLVTGHAGLQSTDRVDLGNHDAGALVGERFCGAFTDVAVAANHRDLAGDKHVKRSLDPIDERVAAAVHVVKLRLGHRVVHVNRLKKQLAALLHLHKPVHAGGGLLGHTHHGVGHIGPINITLRLDTFEKVFDDLLFLAAGLAVHPVATVLQLDALVNEQRRVTAIVNNLIRPGAVWPDERLDCAVPIFLERFAFPRKYRHASRRNGRRRVILRGENVARAPTHIGTQVNERLDENGSLDGHVQ